jgi:hypothetical protein
LEEKMKKIAFLLIIFNICLFLYSQEPVITDLMSDSKLYGTVFFPIFVGEKWNWEMSLNGKTTNMFWNIVSMHTINDPSNNLKNVIGFKTLIRFNSDGKDISELNDEFYLIINDNFISNYKKIDKGYEIEKMLPINPKINDTWIFENSTYKITEISGNSIKVESQNQKEGKTGYQLFVKDTGPFEIYENDSIKKEEIFLTLLESSSFQQPNNATAVENKPNAKDQDNTVSSKTSEITTSQNTNKERIFTDYITLLVKDKKYIQIGAFNITYNAENLAYNVKSAGFPSKIFQDKDGFYKVLVETNDPIGTIKSLKDKTGIKGYLKKQ